MWLFKRDLSFYFLTFTLIGFDPNRSNINLTYKTSAYYLGTKVGERQDRVLPQTEILSAFASRPYCIGRSEIMNQVPHGQVDSWIHR